MKKETARERIEEIGIIPAVRVSSAEEARFAVEAVYHSGIPVTEITIQSGALQVISDLTHDFPDIIRRRGNHSGYRHSTPMYRGRREVSNQYRARPQCGGTLCQRERFGNTW